MKNKVFIFFIILFLPSVLWAASPASFVDQGNQLFKKKRFDEAIKKYEEALKKNPESDVINFNLGTAYYKNGDFDKSIEHLRRSLLSEKKKIQQKAYYNLGNALYKLGIAQEDKNINRTIAQLDGALTNYAQALTLKKKDQDAQWNHDFVKKELERLKKKKNELENQQNIENSKKDQQNKNQESSRGLSSQNQPQQRPNSTQKEEPSSAQDQQDSPRDQGQQNQGKEELDGTQEVPTQETVKLPSEDYNERQESSSQAKEIGELTPEEARMLLKDYENTEEPKGLFKTFRFKKDLKSVEKDW